MFLDISKRHSGLFESILQVYLCIALTFKPDFQGTKKYTPEPFKQKCVLTNIVMAEFDVLQIFNEKSRV